MDKYINLPFHPTYSRKVCNVTNEVKGSKRSNLVEKTLGGLSPIQTIMKIAEERNIKKMGVDPKRVISFGGGWCNHRAPKELVQAYKEVIDDTDLFHKSGRYSSIVGNYHCRQQLCRFEEEIFGLRGLRPENIMIGHSSTQLFHDILRVLCNPSETIGMLDPTYANYFNAVKIALPGSRPVFIPALDTKEWSYLTRPEKSLEMLKEKTEDGLRTMVIPVPDNPTSQIPANGFLKGCYEIIEDRGGHLILDLAYKALWFKDMPPCFHWSPNEMPNLVALHSNSKWLSSLGRRMGWIEGTETVIKGAEKINESMLLSADTMHSMTTARFLEHTIDNGLLKQIVNDTRHLYQNTARVTIRSLDQELGWSRLEPQGGLYTVCPTPERREPVEFVEQVLKNTGVLLIPGKGFGPSMKRGVRISYGPLCYDHDKIKEGMKRIREFLDR